MKKQEHLEAGWLPPLLDPDDLIRMKEPDWKCVYTYIQEFYRCLVEKGLVKTKKRCALIFYPECTERGREREMGGRTAGVLEVDDREVLICSGQL
ncbi:hypothetical protein F7725_015661 [Dissostichus mawsoni]|uniref:Uncharacterized protein n=1 Tax=Dissostichus mawsoni TaxID=36200 RepID=A0A7J5YI72_DISMA|nr:hypothetical protein F7725_015661 [Dissostichus mawsoni]